MLENIRKIKSRYIIAALVAGLVMVILSNSFSDDGKEEKAVKKVAETPFDYQYASLQLKEIIGGIDGVSDVSVFISYENQGSDKIASVREAQSDNTKTLEKTREVMEKDGSKEKPFVREKVFPEVRGVIIAARGIKRKNLEEKITDAVSAALGVPVHRVKILSKD